MWYGIDYNAYNETITSERDKESKHTVLGGQVNSMQSQIQTLISVLHNIDELSKSEVARQLIQNGTYKECSHH